MKFIRIFSNFTLDTNLYFLPKVPPDCQADVERGVRCKPHQDQVEAKKKLIIEAGGACVVGVVDRGGFGPCKDAPVQFDRFHALEVCLGFGFAEEPIGTKDQRVVHEAEEAEPLKHWKIEQDVRADDVNEEHGDQK